jgi:hypothetical protein
MLRGAALRCLSLVFQRWVSSVFPTPSGANRRALRPKDPDLRPDWASFFAREIDPEVAGWELEREQPEDRDVFGDARAPEK